MKKRDMARLQPRRQKSATGRWRGLVATAAGTAILFLSLAGVIACAEVPPEPPVLVGAMSLQREDRVPERFSLAVPVINRGSTDLQRYTVSAVVSAVVSADSDDGPGPTDELGEQRSAARIIIETSVPAGARRVDTVTFDCPFPVVPAAPLRLERIQLREFIFGGITHQGVLRYPDVVEER